MRSEKRFFDRQDVDPLAIQGLISISDLTPIADGGLLVEASPSGFRLEIKREELCDPSGDVPKIKTIGTKAAESEGEKHSG